MRVTPPEDLDLHATRTGRGGSMMGSEWERTYGHRKDVEQLQARQYWRTEWRSDVSLTRAFDLGDASTLGASSYSLIRLSNLELGCFYFILSLIIVVGCRPVTPTYPPRTSDAFVRFPRQRGEPRRVVFVISFRFPDCLHYNQRYINEHDAVREVLMALQGRKNILMTWFEDESDNGSGFMVRIFSKI